MEIKPWMENLTPEDMPNEELKTLATLASVETALILISTMPGININVPRKAFRSLIAKYIQKNYDGTRASQIKLSLECDVSEQYIYKLVKSSMAKNRKY
jgi:hypothetical protein